MDGSKVGNAPATIAAALALAQLDMGPALKDSLNPAFKSKYADLAAVMNACLPALNKHGIALIQPTVSDEMGRAVKTILIHGATGETLECRVDLIVGKNDMQGYGSAVTYARRYGLMCMAGIAPEDDDGNAAVVAAPKPEDRKAAFDAQVSATIRQIGGEKSVESLIEFWKDLNTREKAVAADPRVIKAKDYRKTALSANADLGGDEIPY